MNAHSPSAPTMSPMSEGDRNAIIAGVLTAMLLAALEQMIVAPAMPTIGAALGQADYLPWIITAYLLTATATAPLYGKFSDIFGRRPTVAAAIFVFLAGSLVCALAPSMLVLILGRAMQGLGGGGLFTMAQTVIGDLVPPRERGRYAAWISGTWATASIAGPILGGWFAEHWHWSLIFWINFPLGLLALLVMNGPLKKLAAPPRRHRIDFAAAALLIAATSLLMLALSWGGQFYPWLSLPIGALIGGSALLWLAFAVRLAKAEEPLISLGTLCDPIVLTAASASFMAQFALVGVSVYLPLYFQLSHGLRADQAGMALLGLMIGTVIGASTSGRLMAHIIHYKRFAIVGAILAIACLVGLGFTAGTQSLLLVELLTIGAGIGVGTLFPILSVSVQNAVGLSDLGAATGVNIFLRSLGGAFGAAAMGAIALAWGLPLAQEGAATALPAGLAAAFAAIFLGSAAAMIAALALLIVMREKPLEGRADRRA